MTQSVHSTIPGGRRCPNCGSRVAQNAESCYFCGHELTGTSRRRPARLTLRDAALALALLVVVIGWWQFGRQGDDSRPPSEARAGAFPPPQNTVDAPSRTAGADERQTGPFIQRHTVQEGQTLLGIVAQYGVTVEDVQAANNLSGTQIRAGEILLIPVPLSISENESDNGGATISTIFKYTVRPGDTLISIAVRFGTNVTALQEANKIGADEIIRPGQELLVPVSGVPSTILATGETRAAAQSGPLYEAPQLVGPNDGERIPRGDSVLFRWLSAGLLEQNEWYVLYIWPLDGFFELPPPVWTKATSFRLSNQWAPPSDRDVTYRWRISVVRVFTDAEGERGIEAAGVPSDVRSFIWSGRGG